MTHPSAQAAQPPRLSPADLIGPAARALTGAGRRLWPVWAGLTGVVSAITLGLDRMTAAAGEDAVRSGWITVGGFVALGAATAVFNAPAFRILVGRPEHAWRVDRGTLGYLAFEAAAATLGALWVLPLLILPDAADTAGVAAYGGRSLVLLAAAPLAVWAALRVSLWPLGILMGARDLPLRRAWRLMGEGAVFALLASVLVLALAPSLIGAAIGMATWAGPAGVVLGSAFSAVSTLAATAVGAELYRRRVGAVDLAQVFD